MGFDFGSAPWSAGAMPRGGRYLLFILTALILLLGVPLYQLGAHDNIGIYYKNYISEHISKYIAHGGVYNNTLHRQGTKGAVQAQWNTSTNPCHDFPNMDDITLIMKTGATEAYDKLPTQLLTNLQCVPDFLLFSDMEQQIGQYHIYNVLDKVNKDVKKGLMEFDLYEAQQSCPVSQKDCTKDMKGGWELDKYKFLNMIERAWEMRPNKEWYVFAEADTYVFWPNLINWLRTKANVKEAPYVGSVAFINNRGFAHGGSGYVIHGETVKKMVAIPHVGAKYDKIAPNECCGDLLMALAVLETGPSVKQAHPMFNGEKPNTLPYGNGHWCEPLFTMHHMNSEEVSSVWQYEQTRTKKDVLQIKDMYQAFFAPHLRNHRLDWDNFADDTCYINPDPAAQEKAGGHEKGRQKEELQKSLVEKRAHLSAAACAKVCEAAGLDIPDKELEDIKDEGERDKYIREKYKEKSKDANWVKGRRCFQWRYNKGICCTASSFKLGKPKHEKNKDDRYMSGWFVDGINDWIKAKGECKPEWKTPH